MHFGFLVEEGMGVNQSIPIVLAIGDDDKQRLEGSSAITLKYNGKAVAILRNPEIFPHRKEERCARQFGTIHKGHPYIKVLIIFLVPKKKIKFK